MHLSVSGSGFSPHLFDEIELLTGAAQFLIPTFQYDVELGRVTFSVERCPFRELKRPFFGVVQWAVYLRSERVRTMVEIGNVVNAELRRSASAPAGADRFYIERGMAVTNDQVWIDSVEEDAGRKLFRLVLAISRVDIRLDDVTE